VPVEGNLLKDSVTNGKTGKFRDIQALLALRGVSSNTSVGGDRKRASRRRKGVF